MLVSSYGSCNSKVCANCLHSKFNEKYLNTVPSIHTCLNKESEYYKEDQAWSCTCDKFLNARRY